jgi:hypothetical protein
MFENSRTALMTAQSHLYKARKILAEIAADPNTSDPQKLLNMISKLDQLAEQIDYALDRF